MMSEVPSTAKTIYQGCEEKTSPLVPILDTDNR